MKKYALLNRFLDLLYPPRCILCHRFLQQGERELCPECRGNLPILPKEERSQTLSGISSCCSLFDYEGEVRQSVLRYKFGGRSFYGRIYGDMLAEWVDRDEYDCDIITWVPLSRKRKRSRGYDQAKLIADAFARRTGIPCRGLLKKIKNTAPQSGTDSREARRTNIADAYMPLCPEEISGSRILLMDDIVTTGATLSECAKVLTWAGAKDVRALTLARTRQRSKTINDAELSADGSINDHI